MVITASPTPTINLLGAGKMGFAMLQGWAALGLAGANASVYEPHETPELVEFCAARGIRLNPPSLALPPDILVLAIKPQMLDAAADLISAQTSADTLLISILAGKSIADLAQRAGNTRAIIRAMPNTPAAIGRGITGLAASPAVTAAQRAQADKLLSAVGSVEWLDDESLIDAVTAVSGSGPAYVFWLTECLAKAGQKAGLPEDLALRLARSTIEGSGELMRRSPKISPAALRENVTSPGGTTAAALEILRAKNGLEPLMDQAIAAAVARAKALAG